MVKTENWGVWIAENIGKNIYKVYPEISGNPYITMTGSNDDTELPIGSPHRWIRAEFRNADSSNADSGDYCELTISRETTKTKPAQFSDILFQEYGIIVTHFTEPFGEGYEYEASVWRIRFRSTATNRIYPVLYIQKLAEAQK